ncbi:MAG: AMP-binding protein [Deltaproteobacteria bacterium]|nr:AMP-binding protein [Deltaproteobacteria bacterium]
MDKRSLSTQLQSILSQESFVYPGNLGGLLDRAIELYPNRNGIAVPDTMLTFSEYYDRVCRMVHGLRKAGLEQNDKVLFLSQNSLHYAFISLAVFRIGAVLVPLNPRMRHYEMAHIASETRPKFILCERNNIPTVVRAYELLEDYSLPRIVTIDERHPSVFFLGDIDLSRSEPRCEPMEPDATAMVVYTASKEGCPLGAKLTHASLFYDTVFVRDAVYDPDDTEREVTGSILPLFHTYGFTTGLMAPLAGGVTALLLSTSMGGRKIVDVMEAYLVTQILSVPAIYFSILKPLSGKPSFCSKLRNVVSGGVAMPIELLERYKEQLGLSINEGYGITEASPVVSWNRIDRPAKFGTVGCPLLCCEVKVVDDNGDELSVGQEGEVLVRGLNLFSGYLDREECTREAFVDGWFRTGDLGYLDEENYLTLTGLKKDMVNIFGLKVYPSEVKRIFLNHPDIESASIWGAWDEKYGNLVACEITTKPGREMSVEEFLRWCRHNISPYKIPRKVKMHAR